ncbi:MAG TPA: hypothetical protein VF171_02845, partial [Trueperaceae bacterium]
QLPALLLKGLYRRFLGGVEAWQGAHHAPVIGGEGSQPLSCIDSYSALPTQHNPRQLVIGQFIGCPALRPQQGEGSGRRCEPRGVVRCCSLGCLHSLGEGWLVAIHFLTSRDP